MTAPTLPPPAAPPVPGAQPNTIYVEEPTKSWYQMEFFIGRAVKLD